MPELTEHEHLLANKILRLNFGEYIYIEKFFPKATLEQKMCFYNVRTYLKRNGLISRNRDGYINAAPKTYKKKRPKKPSISLPLKIKTKKRVKYFRSEFESAVGKDAKINALRRACNDGKIKLGKDYSIMREAWIPKTSGKCEVCKENFAYCKHHIVPLSKGGNNSDNNLINICYSCHERVHDFMRKKNKEAIKNLLGG